MAGKRERNLGVCDSDGLRRRGVGLKSWLVKKFTAWLVQERARPEMPLCDFAHLALEIRPCDVLLVEGRSRVSDIIKNITQTIWTHSALYIGRLEDIDDPGLRALIEKFYQGDPGEQLIIEALLGEGTLINPLSKYRGEHLRICRPKSLSQQACDTVTAIATTTWSIPTRTSRTLITGILIE